MALDVDVQTPAAIISKPIWVSVDDVAVVMNTFRA
jgi:hypothetical protein